MANTFATNLCRSPRIFILMSVLVLLDQWSKHFTGGPYVINQNLGGSTLQYPFALSFQVAAGLVVAAAIMSLILSLKRNPEFLILNFFLCVFTSGLIGNVLDRIFFGGVIDFLKLGPIVYNLADLFQVLGFFLSIVFCCSNFKKLWSFYCRRERIWIIPSFQRPLLRSLIVISLLQSLIMFLFSLTYLIHETKSIYLCIAYLKMFLAFQVLWFIFFIPLLVALSARIAGPVMAIKKYADGERGNHLNLREEDYFQEFFKK